jgi:hypothetical protein
MDRKTQIADLEKKQNRTSQENDELTRLKNLETANVPDDANKNGDERTTVANQQPVTAPGKQSFVGKQEK